MSSYLPKIVLQPMVHRDQKQILLQFKFNQELVHMTKAIPATWSETHKSWYVKHTKENIDTLFTTFKDKAWLDISAIYTKNKKNVPVSTFAPKKETKKEHVEIPEAYEKTLNYRRFSKSTHDTYISLFKNYMRYFKGRDIDTIEKQEIVDYLLHLIDTKNISTSTQNQVINAIKFYYEKVLKRETNKYWIDRPRKERKLPVVLSEEEVMRLLAAIPNRKHLCIASLLYSAGLRRSEVINLKKGDIDIQRRQIKVAGAKGKKDRMTVLSEHMAKLLIAYVEEYQPEYWLFEGSGKGMYSRTSVGNIIVKAGRDAKLAKHVTPHVLRHSFATHLMDQGIETRFIQTLLGHSSLTTTAMYAHVSTRSIDAIRSPLDTILRDLERTENNSSKRIDEK